MSFSNNYYKNNNNNNNSKYNHCCSENLQLHWKLLYSNFSNSVLVKNDKYLKSIIKWYKY